ncbi:TM1266 family iron-only hydrogenase system putative regulator [Breznakiellaceae bacterium SP9]
MERLPPTRRGLFALYSGRSGMERIAVVGAIIENPRASQKTFNDIVSAFKGIVRGRMGIPMEEYQLAVISITLQGSLDEINALTGKLGNLRGVTVKTAVSSDLKAHDN